MSRCGHHEQVGVGTKWKCAAWGQVLKISESIQNSIELSEVMRTAIESRISLGESLDVLLGYRMGRNACEDPEHKETIQAETD